MIGLRRESEVMSQEMDNAGDFFMILGPCESFHYTLNLRKSIPPKQVPVKLLPIQSLDKDMSKLHHEKLKLLVRR